MFDGQSTDPGSFGKAILPTEALLSPPQRSEGATALQASDLAEAGPPSNTPASNRKEVEGNVQTGGLDTLVVRLKGTWRPEHWTPVRFLLERCKERAAAGEVASFETPEGDRLVVKDHGVKAGDGHYSWVCEWEGFRILIKDQPLFHERYANVVVELGSSCLMEHGHLRAWEMVRRLLESCGYRLSENQVSRVDPCIDLPNIPLKDFIIPFVSDHCVRRARKGGYYFDGKFADSTGILLGSGIAIRIYDKLKEVLSSGDLQKLDLLKSRRWGGVPTSATRVEFQVKREALKNQFRVETIEDLFKRLPDIVAWLTFDWFRLTDGDPDGQNGNQRRSEVLPLWESVRNRFAEWCGQVQMLISPRARTKPNPIRLSRMILGCMTSIVAVIGKTPESVDELLSACTEHVQHAARKAAKELNELVFQKREKLRAASGSSCLGIDETEIPF